MDENTISRRDFLKGGAAAAIAGAAVLAVPEDSRPGTTANTKVVLVRNRDVLDERGRVREEVAQLMLDQAVTTLTGIKDRVGAWKRLVKPADVVGIKTNVWEPLRTPPELENAISRRLTEAGVPAAKIGVRDRGLPGDPIFTGATALVNIRPLRTHHWAGVGSCIKNYIMFVNEPWVYHPDTCADLAAIWQLPIVKGKTRLNILLLFSPLFHSVGPHGYDPKYTWHYCGMLAGFDPVAVDSTGVRLLQMKRKDFFGEDRPINPPPKHVFLADTRHHLGTADPARIDLVKLGWQEGSFI
ncbi:MAG: DUF362 domain-containing protein [Acidobacteriota bacterium]